MYFLDLKFFDEVGIARHGDLALQIPLIGYKRRNELREDKRVFLLMIDDHSEMVLYQY